MHGVTEDWGLFFSVAEREQVALDSSIKGLILAQYKRVYGQPWYEVGVSAGKNRKGSRADEKRAQRERKWAVREDKKALCGTIQPSTTLLTAA